MTIHTRVKLNLETERAPSSQPDHPVVVERLMAPDGFGNIWAGLSNARHASHAHSGGDSVADPYPGACGAFRSGVRLKAG